MSDPVAFYVVYGDGEQLKCIPQSIQVSIDYCGFDKVELSGFIDKSGTTSGLFSTEDNPLKKFPVSQLISEIKRKIQTKENQKT